MEAPRRVLWLGLVEDKQRERPRDATVDDHAALLRRGVDEVADGREEVGEARAGAHRLVDRELVGRERPAVLVLVQRHVERELDGARVGYVGADDDERAFGLKAVQLAEA